MATVLIADDDQRVRELLKRMLETAGYETITASNGNEALKLYQAKKPDLLIIDIVMPEKEGIETIIELRNINPDVSIIAISGGGTVGPETYLGIAEKLGAKETIEKPIVKDELISKVSKVLSGD